jgi:prepilin signal peptidase PulO-like enzyme (type II secretory pathway)
MINAIVVGILGVLVGSFLNVVNLRFGQWKSIATTRSHCVHCKYELGFWDLVPIFSFLFLGGKCKYCKAYISWQYITVELTAGALALLIWYKLLPSSALEYAHAAFVIIFAYIMLLISIEDVKEMAVDDRLFIIGFIVAVLVAITGKLDVLAVALGIVFAALPLLVLVAGSKERWMGWGDVFIAVSIGIVLGFPASLVWLLGSFWIGAIIGLLLISAKIKSRKDPVPFVPILLISFIVAFYWGENIANWYLGRF